MHEYSISILNAKLEELTAERSSETTNAHIQDLKEAIDALQDDSGSLDE